MSFVSLVLRRWPLFAFLASGAMLAIAHAFQTFGGLAPCHLCLIQRQVYWWALAVSAIAAAADLIRPWSHTPRIGSLALAVIFAVGVYWAGFHAGAEYGWWKAPASCASNGPATMAGLKAFLAGGARDTGPVCDKPAWVFLGISMAGWNCVASVGLVLISLAAAVRGGQRKETAA
jgi:disulfide bond formation protein DsbB